MISVGKFQTLKHKNEIQYLRVGIELSCDSNRVSCLSVTFQIAIATADLMSEYKSSL